MSTKPRGRPTVSLDGNVGTTPRKARELHGKPQAANQGDTAQRPREEDPGPYPTIAKSLAKLLSYDEGWARFVPHVHDGTLFLKWKWSKGDYANHYVMAVVKEHELQFGLALLVDKVEDVVAGVANPVRDTPWHE
jgi:hypothetical protein